MLDIQTTIRHAISKLLHDVAVSHEARVKRALGLKVLGTIFRATAPSEATDARSAIEQAMRAAMFKAQESQHEKEDTDPHPSHS